MGIELIMTCNFFVIFFVITCIFPHVVSFLAPALGWAVLCCTLLCIIFHKITTLGVNSI